MVQDLNKPVDIQLQTDEFFTLWAKYTVDNLHDALNTIGVDISGPLFSSILKQLEKNGGDVHAVIIKFLMYGRFVDMGVGRGVTIANLKALTKRGKINKRKRKTWFSKTYYKEVAKVKELYITKFNRTIPFAIQEAITSQIELHP